MDRVKLVHILILCSRLCGEFPLYGSARDAIVTEHLTVGTAEREADATRVDISVVDNRLVDQIIQITDICQIIADRVRKLLLDKYFSFKKIVMNLPFHLLLVTSMY